MGRVLISSRVAGGPARFISDSSVRNLSLLDLTEQTFEADLGKRSALGWGMHLSIAVLQHDQKCKQF